LPKHHVFIPGWVRNAIAALCILGLVSTSGCVNGESVVSTTHDASAAARAHRSNARRTKAAARPTVGDVLVAGGADASDQSLPSAEFFDPTAGKFVATADSAASRAGAAAAAMPASTVLLSGGFDGTASVKHFSLSLDGNVLKSAEVFDPTTGAFTSAAPMNTPRMGFTATPLDNGKVLVAGGLDNSGDILDSAELYDPAARKFTAVAITMSDRRIFHTATLLQGGKVLITGGATNLSGDTTNSVDLYDPATNSFTATNFPLDHERAAHTATLMTTGPLAGKVLIAGGGGGSSFFFKDSSAELYDPASQQFHLLASFLNEARSMHTATLLDDGNILLAGGFNGSVAISGGVLSGASGSISNSAETFDPNTLEFTCVGGFNTDTLRCNQSMSVARAGHTATLLSSGPLPHRVLLAGGIGASDPNAHGVALSNADLFNPANGGSFTATGAMSTARALHTATLLH
jgi:hypothetical protein